MIPRCCLIPANATSHAAVRRRQRRLRRRMAGEFGVSCESPSPAFGTLSPLAGEGKQKRRLAPAFSRPAGDAVRSHSPVPAGSTLVHAVRRPDRRRAQRRSAARELNRWLATLDAEGRIDWALRELDGVHALSTSFGAQAAVALHMTTRLRPDIPVILVDTGYLFPETYRFADELVRRLALNLKVFQPTISAAWSGAPRAAVDRRRRGGIEGCQPAAQGRTDVPRAEGTRVGTWIAGLRRTQAESRSEIDFAERSGAGNCIRSPTGTIATSANTSSGTTCPTTRSGTKATCRSATRTPPGDGSRDVRGGHPLLRAQARMRAAPGEVTARRR